MFSYCFLPSFLSLFKQSLPKAPPGHSTHMALPTPKAINGDLSSNAWHVLRKTQSLELSHLQDSTEGNAGVGIVRACKGRGILVLACSPTSQSSLVLHRTRFFTNTSRAQEPKAQCVVTHLPLKPRDSVWCSSLCAPLKPKRAALLCTGKGH